MIGLNAGKLDNVVNIIMFGIGVCVLVYSCIKASK